MVNGSTIVVGYVYRGTIYGALWGGMTSLPFNAWDVKDNGHDTNKDSPSKALRDGVGADTRAVTDQARLVAAIDTLADSMVMYDADDRLVLANQTWWNERRVLGITPELGSTYEENIRALVAAGRFPDSRGQEDSWLTARLERRRNPSSPFEIETNDSSRILVTDHHLADGGIITIITDITAQKKAEDAAEMLRVVSRATHNASSIEEAAQRCIMAVCAYTRWPVGHLCVAPDDQPTGPFKSSVWRVDDPNKYGTLEDTTRDLSYESGVGLVGKVIQDGTAAWTDDLSENDLPTGSGMDPDTVLKSGFAFPIFVGETVGAVLEFRTTDTRPPDLEFLEIMNDVGALLGRVFEHEQANKKSFHDANYDRLTGLPNRTLGTDRLGAGLTEAAASDGILALLFLDLDGFKKVNDSLGHATGDRLLQDTAQRLQGNVRTDDTVVYWGGDEFVVVLTSPVTPETAEQTAQRLVQACSVPHELDGYELTTTASIGIAISPYDGSDPKQLIANAESAMYAAKDAGRNQFHFFTSDLNEKAIRHLQMESNLRRGMAENEFTLHYQPIFRLATHEIVGAEALLRWRKPNGQNISPDEFIPVAEDTGLIVPIGEWVLRTASSQAKQWQERFRLSDFSIAVNVSALQVIAGNFVETVRRTLQETGLKPSLLELEITERLLIRNDASTAKALNELKAAGIRLAIDDFGTGYSALSYLKEFPFDVLKIDRSFVDGVMRDQESAGLTRSIIMMAHSLGLEVIAEGIEDQPQLSFLREHKCELGQGYGLGKPMPADQFTALIEEHSARSGAANTKQERPAMLEF